MRSRHGVRAPQWNPDVAPCRMRDILPPIPHESPVSRPALVAALLATALAAWLSQGTAAVTGAGDSRVALLPLSISAALIVALATAGVVLAWRLGASLAPLWLLLLLVLPWLSASLAAALLIWSRPLALTVWLGIMLALAFSSPAIVRAVRERLFQGVL